MNVNVLKILFVHCPPRVVFWAYIEPDIWGINKKNIFWPLILTPKSHSTSGVAFGQVPDLQVFAWPTLHYCDQPSIYCFIISSRFIDTVSLHILFGLTFYISSLINFSFFFSQSWWSSFQTSVNNFVHFAFCFDIVIFLLLSCWGLLKRSRDPTFQDVFFWYLVLKWQCIFI